MLSKDRDESCQHGPQQMLHGIAAGFPNELARDLLASPITITESELSLDAGLRRTQTVWAIHRQHAWDHSRENRELIATGCKVFKNSNLLALGFMIQSGAA